MYNEPDKFWQEFDSFSFQEGVVPFMIRDWEELLKISTDFVLIVRFSIIQMNVQKVRVSEYTKSDSLT